MAHLLRRPDRGPGAVRVVGNVCLRRLGGHHVRVQRRVKPYGPEQRAQGAELSAALRAQRAAEIYRVVKAPAHAEHADRLARKDLVDRSGQRPGDLVLLAGAQLRKARHLHGQPRDVPLTAIQKRLQLVLERAVQGGGIAAVRGQRMGIDEGMKRGVRPVVREEAAAIRARQLAAGAGVRECEQEVVRLLRVQNRAEPGHQRRAGRGDHGEEEGVGALAAGQHGAAQRRRGEERQRVACA